MNNTFNIAGALAALCLVGAVMPARATVVFSDDTFNDADWTRTAFTSGSGGSSSASQQTTGGNPGNYFQVSNSVNSGGSSDAFFGRGAAATYTPSTQGAISGIDYTVDQKLFSGSVGDAEIALAQNGNVYFGFPEVNVTSGSWNTFTLSALTAASFARLIPGSNNGFNELVFDPSQNPDFSATGSAIEFGFGTTFNSPSPGGGAFSGVWGVDNWMVTVDTSASAPEPAALALFGFGLAALAIMRRRRTA